MQKLVLRIALTVGGIFLFLSVWFLATPAGSNRALQLLGLIGLGALIYPYWALYRISKGVWNVAESVSRLVEIQEARERRISGRE